MSGDSFTEGVEPAQRSSDQVQPSAKVLPEESIRTGSADAPPVAAGRSFFSIAGALLRSTRPQQWVKNALVFAGVIFLPAVHRPQRRAVQRDWLSVSSCSPAAASTW